MPTMSKQSPKLRSLPHALPTKWAARSTCGTSVSQMTRKNRAAAAVSPASSFRDPKCSNRLQVPVHTHSEKREVVFHRIPGIESPQGGGHFFYSGPVVLFSSEQSQGAAHITRVYIQGQAKLGGGNVSPEAEVNALVIF